MATTVTTPGVGPISCRKIGSGIAFHNLQEILRLAVMTRLYHRARNREERTARGYADRESITSRRSSGSRFISLYLHEPLEPSAWVIDCLTVTKTPSLLR